MKKKILSLFLALAMCLSLLPTAAFAADGAQDPAEPGEEILAPEQLGDPEKDPDPEQEEQQADSSVKQDEAVAAVQALMDALPGEVTADNADELQAQLMAIDAALEALSGEQLPQFLTRYEAVCEALSSLTAVQPGETHEHYLCGGDTCNQEGHALEDGKTTFKAWDKTAATTTGGAYYLTGNVYGFTVPEGVNLALCLNGYNITSDGVQNEDVITVEPGATFTLCDCKRGGKTDYGTIGHRKPDQYNGSGVTVENGMFNMYGGKIANNTVGYFTTNKSNGYGGGVLVFNKGIFNMIGGEITGNRAKYGGGVSVGTAYGLHDNTAEDIGGTFNMTGGEISGNFCTSKGGGVYACVSSKLYFTVSGSAQITDNYTGNLFSSSPTEGTANNVYLEKYTDNKTGETIMATIKVGTLDSTASIGVTTEEVGQTVATGVSEAAAKCFTSDDSKYRLTHDSGAGTLTMATAGHSEHPVCGDVNCSEHGDSISNWTGVSDLSKITAAGNYYLTQDIDVETKDAWMPVDGVVLCLNGYSITYAGESVNSAISVESGVTFTLCDCVGGGKITHGPDTNNPAYRRDGSGVAVNKNGTFIMYGGSITGNEAAWSYGGGGVSVWRDGVFEMHGGTITNNVAYLADGGGVRVYRGATFTMTCGEITGNTATSGSGSDQNGYGGGVYVYNDSVVKISGSAKIYDNKHGKGSSPGGGINHVTNNVCLPSGKTIQIVGALTSEAYIGVTSTETLSATEPVTVATLAEGVTYTPGSIFSDLGEPSGVLLEGSNLNLYGARPHKHPICGAEHEDIGDHTGACGDVNWTPWDGVSEITYNSENTAYVYLTDNVEQNALTVADGYKLYLCLNGHSLTGTTSGPVITVGNIGKKGSGATLSLCDCKGGGEITHRASTSNKTGAGVSLGHKSTFDMYGGSITDNRSGTGGGVSMGSNQQYGNNKFNMYGGRITNNVADSNVNDGGGGVHNLFGTFTMYGGSITENHADKARNGGGGVYLARTGTFKMYGGSITNNTAQKGGGVYVDSTGLTVSGDVTISGNTDKDGNANNVYLMSNITIQIGGALGENASIGVTTGSTIVDESYLAIAKGGSNYTLKEGDLNAFTSDNTTYGKQLLGNSVVFTNGALHIHAVCGTKDCKDSGHGNELWQPISDESGLRNATAGGHYYLTNNIQLYTNAWTPKNGVVLCLNGKSITANGSFDAITVPKGVTFTLTDCGTTGMVTHVQSRTGCGVQVNGGTFKMYGGSISGNKAAGSGGGVCVTDGTFTMEGGTIGGTGNGNTAYGKGGGGVYVYNSTFTMKNGTISGNSTDDSKGGDAYGGGVYVNGNCRFTMSGSAVISGNTAAGSYGGGVYVEDFNSQSSFTMSDNAAISGNKADGSGGGVCVKYSTFTMNGGTITGNTAKGTNGYGGGVYMTGNDDTPSTFTMNSGTISGNTASDYGGGVCVDSTIVLGGTFNMYGGTITGNNGTYGGGGVYMAPNATMSVSGSVQIKDNWKNGTLNSDGSAYEKGESGTASNLHLGNGKTVAIGTGGLTGEAKIGITTSTAPESTVENTVQFATGATENLDYYTNIFTPDMTGQGYTITQTDNKLYLSAHTHHWKYENSSSAAIKVTCDAPGCNLKSGFEVTYTLTAPAEDTLTYDGNGKPATVVRSAVELPTGVTLPETPTISYSYKVNNNPASLPSGEAPISANTYTASITMGGVTASVTYTIAKANPKADDFTFSAPGNLTYDGNLKTATVTSTKIDADHIKVKYYQGETVVERPTEAGTYTVKIDVEESGNYNAASDLTNGWTFEIAKNTTTPTVTLSGEMVYKREKIEPTATVKIGNATLVKDQDYTVTYGTNFDAGTNTGVVYIEAKGNYGFEKVIKNFNIAKKPITVTADNKSSRVGQLLAELTYTCTEGLPYEGDTFSGELATNANKDTAGTYDITQDTLTLGNNYDISFTPGTYTVEDKLPQGDFKFAGVENGKVTKTYGDPDFKFEATGQVADSKEVLYFSSDSTVATVGSDGTVHILKVSTTPITITATASATDDYAQGVATYELKVEPKELKAADLVSPCA